MWMGAVVSVVQRQQHMAGVASGWQHVREQEQVGVREKQGVGVTTSHALNTSEVGWRGQVPWLSLNWENSHRDVLG